MSTATLAKLPLSWCDRRMVSSTSPGAPNREGPNRGESLGGDLALVLRRLALDQRFLDAVLADPSTALAPHRLSADDLAALALWLDRRHPGHGVRSLFHGRSDDRPDPPADEHDRG